MEMRKVIPEQHRPKYKRLHSFSSAPSIAQIASYVIFISQALLFYVFLFNQLRNNVDKIIMVCLFTLSLFILMLLTIVTGQLDPTDSLLIASMHGEMDKQALYQMKRIAQFKNTNQERTVNCSYCQSDVKMRSRHCKTCDRCIEQFDHHCIWLNTCVGSKNYRPFFVTVILAFLNMVIFVASTAIFFDEIKSNVEQLSSPGFVFTVILATIVAVFVFLIFNLTLLHIYLMCKGITTYDYILLKREQQKRRANEKKQQAQKTIQKIGQNKQGTNSKIQLQNQDQNEPNETKTEKVENQIEEKVQQKISQDKSYQQLQQTPQSHLKTWETKRSEDRFNDYEQTIKHQRKSQQSNNKYYIEGKRYQNQRKVFSNPSFNSFGQSSFKYIDENPTFYIESSETFRQTKILKNGKDKKGKINRFFLKNFSLNWMIGSDQILEPAQHRQKQIQVNKTLVQSKQEKISRQKIKSQLFRLDSLQNTVANKQKNQQHILKRSDSQYKKTSKQSH